MLEIEHKNEREFIRENLNKPVIEQLELFKEKFKLGRASFFRRKTELREELGMSKESKEFKYFGYKGKDCYFCSKKAVNIHHIDENRKNNSEENKLNLCKGCHNKLHRIYINLKKSQTVLQSQRF